MLFFVCAAEKAKGLLQSMTQDERWLSKFNEIMALMAENHRRPSKYNMEERNLWNWLRHTQKQMNSGELKPERVELFEKVLDLCERYKRVNQWL